MTFFFFFQVTLNALCLTVGKVPGIGSSTCFKTEYLKPTGLFWKQFKHTQSESNKVLCIDSILSITCMTIIAPLYISQSPELELF